MCAVEGGSMRGSVVFMFLALFGMTVCTPPKPSLSYQEQQKKEIVKNLERKTVALIDLGNSGDLHPYCSGVWISKNTILTANHCVNKDETTSEKLVLFQDYRDQNKLARVAIVSATDSDNDLALIIATNPPDDHPIASLSQADVWDGQKVGIVGHTVGLWWSYSEGVISSTRNDVGKFSKLLQISSPAWFGNSGGGAFDEEGNMVGMCSWIMGKAPMMTFFVHKDIIKKFLDANLR